MRIAIIGLIAIITTGCAGPNSKSFTGPDGKVMNTIKCSRNTSECFEKASAVCGGSYQVLDSHSNAGGLLADVMPGPVTWYAMNIQCGPSDGKMPQFTFRGEHYSPPKSTSTTTNCTGYGNSVTCQTEQ